MPAAKAMRTPSSVRMMTPPQAKKPAAKGSMLSSSAPAGGTGVAVDLAQHFADLILRYVLDVLDHGNSPGLGVRQHEEPQISPQVHQQPDLEERQRHRHDQLRRPDSDVG